VLASSWTENNRWRVLRTGEFGFPSPGMAASADMASGGNLNNPHVYLKSLRKTWTRALNNAGIEFFPIYNLRPTYATRLAAAGVADIFISQMMGHAGGLLQTCAKAIMDYRRDSIRKLDAFRESANVTPTVSLPSRDLVQ